MPSSSHRSPTGRAVVAGASLAGLFAARILADSRHFDEIVVLDQDELPDEPVPRRGVGQSHHSHLLQHGGVEVLERLFPGLTDEIDDFGAGLIDPADDMRWYQAGYWKPRFSSDLQLFWCERPRLEWAVRRRLLDETDVRLLGNRKVVDYTTCGDAAGVSGLVADIDGADRETWQADLVVDAMGRGTRTPRIFDEMGLDSPAIHRSEVDLGYTSCKVSHPDDYDGSWKTLAVFPRIPDQDKMGVAYPVDDRRFHVTLGGWCGTRPPADDAGFQAFAESMSHPALAKLLEKTDRVTKLRQFRVPRAVWRRYDQMEDWPAGLIAVGDAVCNFNPVYGQGMTVCARQASRLGALLDDRHPRRASTLPVVDPSFTREFQQRAAPVIRTPWLLATAQDHQFPDVGGNIQWVEHLSPLIRTVVDASGRHKSVHQAFLEVLTMASSPARFLDPRAAIPVASQGLSSLLPGR